MLQVLILFNALSEKLKSSYICVMDVFKNLYQVLILFSAGVILLGMILNLRIGRQISAAMKMLLILAVVNLGSMAMFLFHAKPDPGEDASVVYIFLDSVILLLNLIIGRYVYVLHTNEKSRFESQIKNLFLVSFAAECIFLILIFGFGAEEEILALNNNAFPYIYSFLLLLMLWGSVIPGIRSLIPLFKKQQGDVRLYVLLVLNMLNNIVGLVLFSLRFPGENQALVANMLVNLLFAYYYGYYMISSYFESVKTGGNRNRSESSGIYNWPDLKTHLSHWSETKAYLNQFNPDLISRVDLYPLSDLEKIHCTLRLLNIKSKDIADAMHITTRAVEMQRYRINKKISGRQQDPMEQK